MKKTITMLLAVALLVGLTQCKKNKMESMQETAYITVKMQGDAKTDVNPVTGSVDFVEGDVLYVVNHSKYVGTLTYHDGVFGGTISNAYTGEYMYCYHLGNLKITENLRPGQTYSCNIDLSDQTSTLPVISSGWVNEKYSGDGYYTGKLKNECALVKFNVTTDSPNAATCLTGFYNGGTVDFSRMGNDITILFNVSNDGKIALPPGNGERWAILPPQKAKAAGALGSAFSGSYTGTRAAVPAIVKDDHLTDGIEVNICTKTTPVGALDGVFTINDEGKQVYFSKGTLTYTKSSKVFYFYEPQYQMFKYANGGAGTFTINHFGWATSGYEHGAEMYKPENTSTDNSGYYAYGDATKNLDDQNLTADWGHNRISNGMNICGQWRVLTNDEWAYVVSGRPNAASKCGLATVDTYAGMVLLPDEWTEPYTDCFAAGTSNGFSTNTYTAEEWQQMENAGAVFLIAGSKRGGSSVANIGGCGYYWSSTHCDANKAYAFMFDATSTGLVVDLNRSSGCLVRLVCE